MDILSVVGKQARALHWKSLTLHLESRRATVAGAQVPATGAEFSLLHILVSRRNVAMSKDAILNALFGDGHRRDPRMVDVFVARLRTALAAHGLADAIETVAGRGYAVLDAGDLGHDPVLPAFHDDHFALLAA